MNDTAAPYTLNDLLAIMAKLRDPEGGCPWDRQQTFSTIAPYTLEEAYEVAHAIALNDMQELRDELGDLLFQVVFHAQMGSEQGVFDFSDVVQAICEKMIRRHPHVFAENRHSTSLEALGEAWETQKTRERAAKKPHDDAIISALDGVAHALPALTRAVKLQKRAARVGFDWTETQTVIDKIEEELEEVRAEIGVGPQERIQEELGDLLFACTNLARHLKVDPEQALRLANLKFEQRFYAMERMAQSMGVAFESLSLEQMEAHWQQAKINEKRPA